MGSCYRGSEAEVRALSALINLMRAADALTVSLQRELARAEVTPSQFGILEALLHCGELCQGDLAGKLLRSCGSVTAVVDGLERRGLVERRRAPEDKRFVRVALTVKGRRTIGGLFPRHAKVVTAQFSVLSAREQDELRELCRRLGKAVGGQCGL
jgi:MarR family 2-MHQ and catechol resistance regulon transcriptional repressor